MILRGSIMDNRKWIMDNCELSIDKKFPNQN